MKKKTIDVAVGVSRVCNGPCRIEGHQQDVAVLVQGPESDEYLVWHYRQDAALDTTAVFTEMRNAIDHYIQDQQIQSRGNLRAVIVGGIFRGAESADNVPAKVYAGARKSIETVLTSLSITDIRFECENPDARGFRLDASRLRYECKEYE
ncbi:hypothetical protein KY362_01910 [Candidatus Woesearchaeota archaeon]|nr:hypothetical protein [Candidatus Woesearchaeota archaeon]